MPKPPSNAPKSSLPIATCRAACARRRRVPSSRRSRRCAACRARLQLLDAQAVPRSDACARVADPSLASATRRSVDVEGQRRNLRRIDGSAGADALAGTVRRCAPVAGPAPVPLGARQCTRSKRPAIAAPSPAGTSSAPCQRCAFGLHRGSATRGRHHEHARIGEGAAEQAAASASRRRCAATAASVAARRPCISAIQSIASSASARPVATRPCAGAASSTRALPSAMRTPVWPLALRARTAMRLPRRRGSRRCPAAVASRRWSASGCPGRLAQRRGQGERRCRPGRAQLQQRQRLSLPGAGFGISDAHRPRRRPSI